MRSLCTGLILAGLFACAQPPSVGDLTVCLGEADPPRSLRGTDGRRADGFDLEVAQLIARALNRDLQIVWQPKPVQTEIESTDIEYGPLLAGQCDLMLSVPGVDAIIGLQDRLVLSEPYYGTGFELIPENGRLDPASKVAVRANTVAHVVVDARGHNWTMQPDSSAIVATVKNGDADVGLIWGPDLALLEVGVEEADLHYNRSYEPPRILRWNQHALLREDHTLTDDINKVLRQHAGEIMDLLGENDIPAHPPFATTHQSEALRAL
jgi:ABC-type amino acid transport substrate-binding protein